MELVTYLVSFLVSSEVISGVEVCTLWQTVHKSELCVEMPFISGLESNFWRSSYPLIAISGDEKL